MTKKTLFAQIKRAVREVPQIYFAPLVGAIQGIQQQYRQLDLKFARDMRATACRQEPQDREEVGQGSGPHDQ